MRRETGSYSLSKKDFLKVSCSLFVLLIVFVSAGSLFAQEEKINAEYSAKIKEYTTEPFFMTKYVDHLPYSENVPTPLDVLGRIAGAPDVLSYSHEIYRYMRALGDASPRVKVFDIGKTEENRDMMLVVISDERTIRDLDDYKEINAKLADPRKINEREAERLIGRAKPMYWATGALHSGETGSPEMLMELAYRIAVGESDFIKTIRDNMIIMITPVLEVDGRDKVVDLAMAKRKNPDINLPARPLWWGKYVAHDNNRDCIGMGLNLTNNVLKTYMEFHPQVLHDLHESIAYLYTSTGTGPYNAWVDPILVDEWHEIAYAEVSEMTRMGVPGVWTHGFYDGWAPNYLFYVANGHNSIGRFYETQTAGDGTTRVIRSSDNRDWFKPNPPLREAVWSLRNNVNYQQSGILIAMNHVAKNREKFMENYYMKGKRSIAKAENEGPAAYIFPADDPRPGMASELLGLLQEHGIEVHRAEQVITIDETEYPEGSYVIRMDQPYSRMADLLLDKQLFNTDDPRPYDDVGWTLGPYFNVQTVRIEDTSVLDARMKLVKDELKVKGGVDKITDDEVWAYVINHNADNSLATFRFENKQLFIEAAEEEFEIGEMKFNPGTFIMRLSENSGNLERELKDAAEKYGFTVYGISEVPDIPSHLLEAPRIAIMHTWQSTQTEGWLRMGFDKLNIPYDYISIHDIRDESDLKGKYDVIIFGPSSNNVNSILSGLPMRGEAMPWKKTELTPNIGIQDETDDMRGGMEFEGVINLYNFVKQGGTFITLANSSVLPVYFNLSGGMVIKETQNLWARGGVYKANVGDKDSPIVYGYGDELGVYFNSGPVFGSGSTRVRGLTEPRSEGSTQGKRPSGRGDLKDKDVVQGRPKNMGAETVKAFREAQKEKDEESPAGRRRARAVVERFRTILRFERKPEELLISGGMDYGEELAGSPAVADSQIGAGHFVMFSINPFWRNQTRGSYFLVFNTIMNYRSLHVGK
ncbi:M14 family zinc carboxypeptidase [candidate division KSB1 bacterium]